MRLLSENGMVQRRIFPSVMLAAIGLLATSASSALAQSRAPNTLQQVLINESGDTLTVTLVATGTLIGVLKTAGDDSQRLYIDCEGVESAITPVTAVGRPALRRIRVGQFSAQPLITRVVFDVGTVASYRVEPGTSTRELRVILESGVPGEPAPQSTPYLDWFTAMERRVGILIQATSQAIVTRDGGLAPLLGEWTRAQREIESMTASGPLEKAHALLLQAARLGRLEAERGETLQAGAGANGSEDSDPRAVLARARVALPPK